MPTDDDEMDWFTTQGAAKRLGVTTSTLHRFINEGSLTAHRMGRVMRIMRSDVESFIEGARVKPGSISYLTVPRVGA